ncbi:multimerin-2a [Fundulus diaphanus]
MTAVGELVLVLGLLVSARCEVRARDPEVEEEEGGRPPLSPGVTETPLLGGPGRSAARIGNRCAFVQKKVLMVTEPCGSQRRAVKDQSPCGAGSPGCQRITYRLSTQPTFCQMKKVLTSLLWRCCPGHGGPNCHKDDPAGPGLQQRADPNREQNDYQTSFSAPYDPSDPHGSARPDQNPGHRPGYHRPPVYHHQGQNQGPPQPSEEIFALYQDIPAALPVPEMMALVLSQLQPILEGFNRSLEQLNQRVGGLARDVAELRSSPQDAGLQEGGVDVALEGKLDEAIQQVGDIRRQMEEQRRNMENQLQLNLSSFKVDVDQKLKQQQMMLQARLGGRNTTQAGEQLDQDQIPEDQHELHPQHLADNTALWEAIRRLDNMVVNNTVKVDELTEVAEVTSADVEQLTLQLKDLDKQINQTARNSRILFMETGLEVEQSKVTVLRRVEELATDVTLQEKRLQENEKDVDDLYTDCNCGELKAAVARLERGVATVTQLANENRLTLRENSEVGGATRGGARDWEPEVEELQRGLLQVEESLASEQNRTRTTVHRLAQLSSAVSALQEVDVMQDNQAEMLSVSFRSLLQDAIRHSDVLQLLLGEEVLEFLEWPIQDQEAHSIPALKEQVRELQEQLRSQQEARKLRERGAGDQEEEVPSADQPAPPRWPPAGSGRPSGGAPARETPLLLHPELEQRAGDGSDLWKLEKKVEQLQHRLLLLEERSCSCNGTPAEGGAPPAGLDLQLRWLQRGLEEHLRVFKSVFSNADTVAASGDALELDKLQEVLRRRGRKRGGGGRRGGGGGGGGHRSRRASAGAPFPSSQSGVSLLFVGGAPRSAADGTVTFSPSLNRHRFYSDTGVFTAPTDGLYLFILTLHLRPGSAHVALRRVEERGGAPAALQVEGAGPWSRVGLLLLREGEELRLEVRGEWAESESSQLAVLQLRTT